jgi:hypothetical protein
MSNNYIINNPDIDRDEIRHRIMNMISDEDIKRYLGVEGHKNIIKYSELDNYKSIDKFLPKIYDYKIILIESQQNAGHWVIILKYKNKDNKIVIEYFNSYGMKPEADLSYVGSAMNKVLGNDKDNLKELLNDATSKGYEVIYNKKRFQSSNKKVNTCGRWSILRIIMMKHYKMNLEEFIDFITQLKKKYKVEADIVCAMLTP